MGLLLSERCIGAACHVTDFKGVHHPAWILAINDGPVLRIKAVQLFAKCFQTLLLQTTLHCGPCLIVDGGDIVDTVAHSIDIHH